MRGCSGGHAWLHWGGVRGFIWGGVCGFISGGRAWFYSGGMRGFIGGHAWFYSGGAWFYSGGMRGFIQGGRAWFFSFFGYNEIRSMSGRYASYWNAFLFIGLFYIFRNGTIICITNYIPEGVLNLSDSP